MDGAAASLASEDSSAESRPGARTEAKVS